MIRRCSICRQRQALVDLLNVYLEKIADLRIDDRHPDYDKVNNPAAIERCGIGACRPYVAVGPRSTRHSQSGGCGWRLLGDASGIAVVEGPYDPSANRAYIVNAEGSLRAEIAAQIRAEGVMFYDVIEANGSVAFLAAAPGRDVRIEVREADGAIEQVTENR